MLTMAICLHKLASKTSVIKPILKQSKQIPTSSSLLSRQISFDKRKKNCSISNNSPLEVDKPLFMEKIFQFSNRTCNLKQKSSNRPSSEESASEEQLSIIFESLREDLPQFFIRTPNYNHIHKNIVFENRIRGKTYNGITEYKRHLCNLRLYVSFAYADVRLDVIKMTKNIEDSSIKVRWRITGIAGFKILLKMLQFRVWSPRRIIEQNESTWIDGFSTFYVNNEGLIVRHVADKIMSDEDKELNPIQKIVDELGRIPKLALILKLSTDVTAVA